MMQNLNQQNNIKSDNVFVGVGKWKKLTGAISLATSLMIADVSHAEQSDNLGASTHPAIVFVQPFSFEDEIQLDQKTIPANTPIHGVHYVRALNGIAGDMSRAFQMIKENPTREQPIIGTIHATISDEEFGGKTLFISSSDEDIMREIFPNAKIEVSSEIDKSGMFIIARETSLITKLANQWETLAIGGAGGIILGGIGMGVLGRRRKGEKEEGTPSKDQKQKDAEIDMPRMRGAVPPPAPVTEIPEPTDQPSSWKKRWDSIWGKLKHTNKTENKPTETTAEDTTDPSDKGGLARRSWNAVRDRIQVWKYNRELIKNAEGKELLGDKIQIKKIEFFDGENGQSSVNITFNDTVEIFNETTPSKNISSPSYSYSDEMRQGDAKHLADPTKGKLIKIFIKSIVLNGKVLIFSVIPYDEQIIIEEYHESNQTATGEKSDLTPPQDTVAGDQDSEKPSRFSTFFTKIKTWRKADKTESEDGEKSDKNEKQEKLTLRERLDNIVNRIPLPSSLRKYLGRGKSGESDRENLVKSDRDIFKESLGSFQGARETNTSDEEVAKISEALIQIGIKNKNLDPNFVEQEVNRAFQIVYGTSPEGTTTEIEHDTNPDDFIWSFDDDSMPESPDTVEATLTGDQINIVQGEELLNKLGITIESIEVTKNKAEDTSLYSAYKVTTIFQDEVDLKDGKSKISEGKFRIYNDPKVPQSEALIAQIHHDGGIAIWIKYHPIDRTVAVEGNKIRLSSDLSDAEVIKTFSTEDILSIEGIDQIENLGSIEKIEVLANNHICFYKTDVDVSTTVIDNTSATPITIATFAKEDGTQIYLQYTPSEQKLSMAS